MSHLFWWNNNSSNLWFSDLDSLLNPLPLQLTDFDRLHSFWFLLSSSSWLSCSGTDKFLYTIVLCLFLRVLDRIAGSVYIYVVVSCAMHLDNLYASCHFVLTWLVDCILLSYFTANIRRFGLFLSILISVFYLFLFLLSFSANIYDFPFNLKVYDAIFIKIVI